MPDGENGKKLLFGDNMKKYVAAAFVAILMMSVLSMVGCSGNKVPADKADDFSQFEEFAGENPYDAEYETGLMTDDIPLADAAKEYMEGWKAEFAYTIDSAESLFDSAEDYGRWKNTMEANLEAADELYKVQYDTAAEEKVGQMQFLEIKLAHVRSVRELTLNAKYFCFIIEKEKGAENCVSLTWKEG